MRANPLSMDSLTDGKYIIDGFFPFVIPNRVNLIKYLTMYNLTLGSRGDMNLLLDLRAVLKYFMDPFSIS